MKWQRREFQNDFNQNLFLFGRTIDEELHCKDQRLQNLFNHADKWSIELAGKCFKLQQPTRSNKTFHQRKHGDKDLRFPGIIYLINAQNSHHNCPVVID